MPRANIVKKAKITKERESFRLCHLCLVDRYIGTAQGKLQAKFSHVNLLYIQLAKATFNSPIYLLMCTKYFYHYFFQSFLLSLGNRERKWRYGRRLPLWKKESFFFTTFGIDYL